MVAGGRRPERGGGSWPPARLAAGLLLWVAGAMPAVGQSADWRSDWGVATGYSLHRDTEGYRFPTAIAVVSIDHLVRAALWPQAVYGVANPAWWRFLEHAAWVVFESSVLILSCVRGVQVRRVAAERESALQHLRYNLERKVEERTLELRAAAERHRALLEGSAAVPWELDLRTQTLVYIAPQVEQVRAMVRKPCW